MEYQTLEVEKMPNIFIKEKEKDRLILKSGRAKPIKISIPFYLDKEIAKIFGMLFDGSLDKNLSNIMFCQKKDISKMYEVAKIIYKRFSIKPRIGYRENGEVIVVVGNKTFTNFLHYCLDFYKCDESGRLPCWLHQVDISIKKEFLRYAFAMEGSVSDPKTGKKEVRFHNCDYNIILELRDFIKKYFDINFKLYKYFIKNYGWKYYLSINDKNNIEKFSSIGFALKSHENRLKGVLKSYKSKAWEITLIKISELKKDKFFIKYLWRKFPYLKCKRSVHQRVSDLVKMNYLIKNPDKSYSLTKEGHNKINQIKSLVNITKLRTNSKENEKKVLEFLKNNKQSWRNEIARNTNITSITIRDVLRRLLKQNKIKMVLKYKFQRKIYSII